MHINYMGRRKSTEGGEPVSIRISEELISELTLASQQTGQSLHDTMRTMMRLGLRDLKDIGYDTIGAIAEAARKAREVRPPQKPHEKTPEKLKKKDNIHHLDPSHWMFTESERAAEDTPTYGNQDQKPSA